MLLAAQVSYKTRTPSRALAARISAMRGITCTGKPPGKVCVAMSPDSAMQSRRLTKSIKSMPTWFLNLAPTTDPPRPVPVARCFKRASRTACHESGGGAVGVAGGGAAVGGTRALFARIASAGCTGLLPTASAQLICLFAHTEADFGRTPAGTKRTERTCFGPTDSSPDGCTKKPARRSRLNWASV